MFLCSPDCRAFGASVDSRCSASASCLVLVGSLGLLPRVISLLSGLMVALNFLPTSKGLYVHFVQYQPANCGH